MKKNNLHKNNSGFKIPDDYFESFNNKLSKRLSLDIEQNAKLATKIESGFKVPDDYFTSIEDKVLQKINTNKPKGKVLPFVTKRNLLYFSGIAAMITIIISINISKKSDFNFDDIQITDIQTYFNEGNLEFSNEEMALLFDEDNNYTETFEEELINDETLLDYLSEEDLDDEIIYTE